MVFAKTGRQVVMTLICAVLLCNAGGCTVRNLERNVVERNSGFTGTRNVAAFAFVHEKNLEGRDFSGGDLFYAVMSGLTLTMWPWPHDGRFAVAPPLWTAFDERIDDQLDDKFTERLNAELGSVSIPLNSAPTLNDLMAKAKAAGKRYVYVVRYNHYNNIRFQLDREYRGSDGRYS